ncbi:MAG TPA: sensor histidine kinase [Myxococcales bacterium]|jgi:signal transduction histidine kinase
MTDPRFEEAQAHALHRDEPGRRDKALKLLESLVAEGAGAHARFLLASLYDDHPDGYPEAIVHYRAGLTLEPKDSAARNNLAVALLATGQAEEAVSTFAGVVLDDPGYGLATQNLAQLALEQLDEPAVSALLLLLAKDGTGEALGRLLRAAADAGRQEAFGSTYSAGHALKNLIGLAGSKASSLARKVPGEPGIKELAQALEKVYLDWAGFLKAARSVAQRREACDLNELATEVAGDFPEGERPRLTLAKATPLALGDPAALREAVLNLARNAREASPQGHVEISTSASDHWVRATVADDGPGISPADLKRIFVPGFTTKPQGSGFGLSIADRIARAEGGRIDVESGPGRGSRFHLVLPAATATLPRLAPRLGIEEFTRKG